MYQIHSWNQSGLLTQVQLWVAWQPLIVQACASPHATYLASCKHPGLIQSVAEFPSGSTTANCMDSIQCRKVTCPREATTTGIQVFQEPSGRHNVCCKVVVVYGRLVRCLKCPRKVCRPLLHPQIGECWCAGSLAVPLCIDLQQRAK